MDTVSIYKRFPFGNYFLISSKGLLILPTEPVNLIPHLFKNLVWPGDADALPKRHNPTEKLRADIDRTFSYCLLLSQSPSAIVIEASISYLGAKIHTFTEKWVKKRTHQASVFLLLTAAPVFSFPEDFRTVLFVGGAKRPLFVKGANDHRFRA